MHVRNFYKKQVFIITTIVGWLMLAAWPSTPAAQTNDTADTTTVDRIVAIVNDEIITLYDLNEALKPYVSNIKALGYSAERERETLYQVRNDLLDQLINRKLTDQEIKRLNIEISEIEVEKAIERIKSARSYTDEDLRKGLAQQGMTMEDYRNEIKEQILRARVVNQEIKSKVVITSDDIQAYYENHQEKYAGEKKYKLWNLYCKIPAMAGPGEKEAALDQMKIVAEQLEQGESFEDVVKQKSESDSAVQGSELGMFRFEELSPKLQAAVKELKVGEYSPIIDTEFAYQMIYVEKILETQGKSLDAVEKEIQETLYNEYVNARFQEWLDELRKRSHIKIIR